MNNEFTRKIAEIQNRIPAIIKRLPGVAKVEGLNFIHDNFDKEGFQTKNGVFEAWKPRKIPKVWKSVDVTSRSSKLKTTKAGKKYLKDYKKGRNLLIQSGKLRRSWDKSSSSNATQAVFTSSMPYAEPHNDGGRSGRGNGFDMPERKMIGHSEALFDRIENKIDRMVDEIMK